MTSPVNNTTDGSAGASSSSSSSSSTGGIGGLTMNDFLTLMTAQLQNQDPTNPADSNEFLGELSELSTVEGISQLNTTMSSLSGSLMATQAVNSASLVGTTVMAPATGGVLESGSTISGAVAVPQGASGVTLTISNSSGDTVDQIALPTTEGMQTFSWNGVTSTGSTAAPGNYTLTATATVGSTSEAATTYVNATVSSVTLGSSGTGAVLNTPQLGAVPLSDVEQIN